MNQDLKVIARNSCRSTPLAQHEQPIVRIYLEVDDVERAVENAEAAGAPIAYPPPRQADTGKWAIYLLGDVHIGLWQRSARQ
jgi:hypothetical protein